MFRKLQIAVARGQVSDALALWDTPGFGDSVRLARRLAQHAAALRRHRFAQRRFLHRAADAGYRLVEHAGDAAAATQVPTVLGR